MSSLPDPMDIGALSLRGQNKRAAEDEVPTSSGHNAIPNPNEAPRILRRHHHRRRNIAASIWGPDIPGPASSLPHPSAPPQRFNIYKALLRHPNLFFQFALRLPFPTIIDLYAIDKEFHYRLNQYSVGLLHDYARYHAPLASYIFTWALHPNLCISDPMLRPMDGRSWLARDVPSFRWLAMVLWRQRVVRSILTRLAMEGLRVPAACEASLMKYWSLMERKTGRLRSAFLRDRSLWTDTDIANMQLFAVKLDMRFLDPVLGNGVCELSHMLLMQRSLSSLWKVLTGRMRLDYDSATEMVVCTYLNEDLNTDAHPWLDDEVDNGVVEDQWGLMSKEEWHIDGARMESAYDMLVVEGVRRGLNLQQYYLDFVLYGFVDSETGKNIPIPRRWRQDKGIVMPSEGWPAKKTRERLIERLNQMVDLRGRGDQSAMDMSS